MLEAIRERTTVKTGGILELCHPELPVGAEAEVIIMVERPDVPPAPLVSFLGRAKGCFGSVAEVDEFLRGERQSWER